MGGQEKNQVKLKRNKIKVNNINSEAISSLLSSEANLSMRSKLSQIEIPKEVKFLLHYSSQKKKLSIS